MSKFPVLTSKDVVRILQQKGFLLDRSSGSHQIWLHANLSKLAIVPTHNKDLPIKNNL
jgi:predicted RNA binding protein YcfA (HicA-like mRNA interferase family)